MDRFGRSKENENELLIVDLLIEEQFFNGVEIVVCRVAGWKQREHPLLYNVLHIGDLVLSVAGVVPANVAAIKSILKNYSLPRVSMTNCLNQFV